MDVLQTPSLGNLKKLKGKSAVASNMDINATQNLVAGNTPEIYPKIFHELSAQ